MARLNLGNRVTPQPSNPLDSIDRELGEYKDPVIESLPDADRFQEAQMPKADDPSPFKLGPMSPGGR